ncbi:MAG: hypothetical protein HY926_13445 [Elusimicrobia bacterium]|nr:hypothetical protein [Elusimicrobiota bacterium]
MISWVLACGGLSWGAGFTSLNPLPEAFSGHSLVSVSGYLCNIGGLSGTNGALSGNKVFCAQARPDGTVGDWVQRTSLPEPVFFHSALSAGSRIYVLGGYHYNEAAGLFVSSTVYYAEVAADGTVSPWASAAPLPEPAFFMGAAVWDGTIYVTGGWDAQWLLSSAYSADIRPDGSLAPWQTRRSLPQGVYTHAAVSNGTLYLLGGAVENGTLIHNLVYHARINADKSLGEWGTTSPLPQPLSNHAAVTAGGRIIVAGGWTGPYATDAVVAADIQPDQTLGGWAGLPSLPQPLYMHGGAVAGDYLYVSGGMNMLSQTPVQATVYSAPLPAPLPPPAPDDTQAPRTALAVAEPKFSSAPVFITPQSLLSLSATDEGGSGVSATLSAVDDGAFAPYGSPLAIPAEGAHWLRYYSVDAAGNQEAVNSAALAVDATPPVSDLSVGSPQAVLDSGEVVVGAQTLLGVSAEDPVSAGVASGLSQVLAGVDGAAPAPVDGLFALPQTDGAHVVSYQAVDNLGSKEPLNSKTVFLDRTPPATALSISPAPYQPAGGTPVLGGGSQLSFAAQDPEAGGVAAGVNRTEFALDDAAAPLGSGELVLAEGQHTLYYRSVDNVGNSEAVRSASLRVDATAPVSSLDIADSGVSLFGIELLTPQTDIVISAEDPVSGGVQSGVARTLYSVDSGAEQAYSAAFRLPAGAHTVAFRSVDNAGNAEAANSVALSIGSFLTDSVAALDSVTLAGGAGVTGTVRANGDFTASGQSSVKGDVTAMTVKLNGKSTISGTVSQGQATVSAAMDIAAARSWTQANNDNASVASRRLSGGVLVVDAFDNLTLAAGTYYFKGLTVRDLGRLSVDGQAALFIDGPVTVTGLGRINETGRADDLWVFCAGDSVQVAGAARAAFNLYAPAADVSLSGLGQLAGRMLGRSVSLTGMAKDPSPDALPRHWHKGRLLAGAWKPSLKAQSGPADARAEGRSRAVISVRLEPRVPSLSAILHGASSAQAPVPSNAPPRAGKGGLPVFAPAAAPLRLPPLPVSAHAALAQVAAAHGQAVRAADGSGVVVPAGALLAGLAVSVARETKAEAAELLRRESGMARRDLAAAGPAVQFGPEGTRFVKPVTLSLPFDRTLFADATAQASLAVHYWNPGRGDWEALPSVVDAAAGLVRAQTEHFSLYQVLSGAGPAAAGAAVGSARVACNPLRPGCSPLKIGNLPADARVRIYTLSGTLVKDLGADANGEASWDGTNMSGAPSSSGVYFAFAQGAGGSKTIKVAVER